MRSRMRRGWERSSGEGENGGKEKAVVWEDSGGRGRREGGDGLEKAGGS